MFTTGLSRMTISWATPRTSRIHHRIAWFAAWSAVSATFTGEVPDGLVDSFSDWDNELSARSGADPHHDVTAAGRKSLPRALLDHRGEGVEPGGVGDGQDEVGAERGRGAERAAEGTRESFF